MPTFELDPKPLNEKQRLTLAGEHARLELERNAVRQEMRDTNGGYRTQLKEMNKRAKEIAEQLDQDIYRERIEVDEKPIDATFMMQIFRKGTKDELGQREMTAEEKKAAKARLQPELPMNGKGKGNSKISAHVDGKGKDNGIVDDSYVPEGVEHRGQKLSHMKKNKKSKGNVTVAKRGKGKR